MEYNIELQPTVKEEQSDSIRITSIEIINLFEMFKYNISFNLSENVLIITGPNGFGKTMILNVVFNLFNRNFLFFHDLVFEQITITLTQNIKIIIDKYKNENKTNVTFSFIENGNEVEIFNYSDRIDKDIIRYIDRYTPTHRVAEDRWLDPRTGVSMSLEEVLFRYSDQFPKNIDRDFLKIKNDRTNDILNSIQVHLIREQRLFKKAKMDSREYREENDRTIMVDSIQTYAKELKQSITEYSQKSFIKTQDLDSSYPLRLRSERDILTEEEYEIRYKTLKNKQKKLTEFGLYESKQEFLTYSVDDAKALSVYIKDFEQKLSVFDSLLEKLELFTSILNERRFTYKSIKIDKTKGFFFKTVNNKELDLSNLSSGEQHEVVLLYELIFNVKPNILVLIDEPEISLHITWQKEFLNDLLKIIKIQNIQVIVATHAPSIINDRWDLVYNLPTSKN